MKPMVFAAKVIVGGVLLSLVLLNLQPWLEVAESIEGQIRIVPFLGPLIELPWVGGWFLALSIGLAQIIGVMLWAFIQLIQVVPLLHSMGLISARQAWIEKAEHLRWAAYAIEIFVCFLRFPPYEGGIDAFLVDAPNWQLYLVDWWTLALFLTAVTAFEALIMVGALLFAVLDQQAQPQSPSRQQQAQSQSQAGQQQQTKRA